MHIIIHLPKRIECTLVMKHKVNYGLWVIVLCQCSFISCNKCTTLVGVLIMGETMDVWEQIVYGKFLYFPLSVAVN